MLIDTACQRCGEIFKASSFRARYCSDACRNAAYRQRKREAAKQQAEDQAKADQAETVHSPSDDPDLPVYAATLRELRAVHQDGSALGLALLAVAKRIDQSASESGQSLSALVLRHNRQHESTVGRTVADGVEDEVAKAREARDDKRRRAAGQG